MNLADLCCWQQTRRVQHPLWAFHVNLLCLFILPVRVEALTGFC